MIWVCADPHFGHANICKFMNKDGTKLRPWDDANEMDEALVENWNRVVEEKDRIYVLGDVVINRRALKTLGRLKGRKKLIRGNHDIFKLSDYTPYFDDILAYDVRKMANGRKCIMSHIPIHPDSLRGNDLNVHGHLHSGRVMIQDIPDPRYICVSMEHINYAPITLESLVGPTHAF